MFLTPGFKEGKPHILEKSEDIAECHVKGSGLVRKMYLNKYLHYIQLINTSRFYNKNVLCGRDVLYLHTQLYVSSNSSSDISSVNAVAAADVFIIIIVSHSNTYVLFQV
jgi:hypothetical protein